MCASAGPPELGHRGRGPDQGGPFVERKRIVRDRLSGQPDRGPLLAGQPAVAVAEVRQRAPGPVHQEAAVRRGLVEQCVQQIRAPPGQHPPYGREDDRRRFERDDPGDPLVPGRRCGQPQLGRRPERLVVAAFQGRGQPVLQFGQPPGARSQRGGRAQQQPEVGPPRAGVEPGAQRFEHLVFLAPPQDAVQRAEVGDADPARDALQGAQGPVPQGRLVVRGVLDEQSYGERAQRRQGVGRTVPCLQGVGGDPVQQGSVAGAEQPRVCFGERAERRGAYRVPVVAQAAAGRGQYFADGLAAAVAGGAGHEQRPGGGPVVRVGPPDRGEQLGACLLDRAVGEGVQVVPPVVGAVELGRRPPHFRPATLAGQQVENEQCRLSRGPAADDGVHERGAPTGCHGLHQCGEVAAPVQPVTAERGQRRGLGPHEPVQDSGRWYRLVALFLAVGEVIQRITRSASAVTSGPSALFSAGGRL